MVRFGGLVVVELVGCFGGVEVVVLAVAVGRCVVWVRFGTKILVLMLERKLSSSRGRHIMPINPDGGQWEIEGFLRKWPVRR